MGSYILSIRLSFYIYIMPVRPSTPSLQIVILLESGGIYSLWLVKIL
jgi:hypothetical protein